MANMDNLAVDKNTKAGNMRPRKLKQDEYDSSSNGQASGHHVTRGQKNGESFEKKDKSVSPAGRD